MLPDDHGAVRLVHVAGSLQDLRFCNSQVGLKGVEFVRGRAAGKQRLDDRVREDEQ